VYSKFGRKSLGGKKPMTPKLKLLNYFELLYR
jgi:hypothetical protein